MSIDVMKQALEALEHEAKVQNDDAYKSEREALRAAIEQAQAPYMTYSNIKVDPVTGDVGIGTPPPAHQPLTDKELNHLYEAYHDRFGHPIDASKNGWAYERAIEASHGIKREA